LDIATGGGSTDKQGDTVETPAMGPVHEIGRVLHETPKPDILSLDVNDAEKTVAPRRKDD
jgi:hypothetical protein